MLKGELPPSIRVTRMEETAYRRRRKQGQVCRKMYCRARCMTVGAQSRPYLICVQLGLEMCALVLERRALLLKLISLLRDLKHILLQLLDFRSRCACDVTGGRAAVEVVTCSRLEEIMARASSR